MQKRRSLIALISIVTLLASAVSAQAVAHDSTLSGDGTPTSPLGVAAGGINTTQLADYAVTLNKIAVNQVVTGLNGLKENVTLAAGPNITITPSGSTLTIASTATAAGPKAMLRVLYNGAIEACYNSMTGSTSGNCGFNVIKVPEFQGVYRINFGSPVSNRFVSITPEYSANPYFSTIVNPAAFHNAGANYRYFDGTSIEVFTFAADDADDTKDNSFTIILY